MTKTEDAQRTQGSDGEPSGRSPAGPGWFESSWDLGCGLEIREEQPPDDALPREWLEGRLLG